MRKIVIGFVVIVMLALALISYVERTIIKPMEEMYEIR